MAPNTVTVSNGGTTFTAAVETLTDAERDRGWATALDCSPNYQIAQQRAGNRTFRQFAVTP